MISSSNKWSECINMELSTYSAPDATAIIPRREFEIRTGMKDSRTQRGDAGQYDAEIQSLLSWMISVPIQTQMHRNLAWNG